MPTHARVVWAVFKRNFASYFINPTGYVFITVFILLGAMAAFWQRAFFMNNLANLDQLNAFFPYLLLFFIPALTMNVWAEERRQGTDELLFTLPGCDGDIVLGKYFAALGIYTVAILFSLSHLFILSWLGDPDVGLMIATYLGYWLTGAALLAVGMVASLLTANVTVAFILGAVFCGAFVFVNNVELLFGERSSEWVAKLGIVPHFNAFGHGVIPLDSLLYFVVVAVVMLYVNVVLLERRHYAGGEGSVAHTGHWMVRAFSLAVIAVALCTFVGRAGLDVDATAERIHSLQPQTLELIEQIPEDRPVFIQAFFSKDVPQLLVQTRKDLENLLHKLDTVGGSRIRLAIHDTEPFTETATQAAENYNITPQKVGAIKASRHSAEEVFLGLVFTSGPEEFVIPFFHPGLPVEYELARSVRVVSQKQRKKLGIVATDAKVFGGFDFNNMTNTPDWSIVTELRKQYNVEQVQPTGPYPDNLDALLVVMPSSMIQEELDELQKAVLGGMPTLLLDDPFPAFSGGALSPQMPKDANRNPFTSQGQPPPKPKGNFDGLLASIGLRWDRSSIVWSGHNPHPAFAGVDPEIVFVCEGPDNKTPFSAESAISSGLQEVVMLFPGFVRGDQAVEGALLTRAPLLKTGYTSGDTGWDSLFNRSFFGIMPNPNVRRYQTPDAYTLAMHVTGTLTPELGEDDAAKAKSPRHINVIVIGDVDIISEAFFNLRRQGAAGLNFDNVTFALNCIDVLAGDESFVELRKHRPQHRTLTRVEARTKEFAEKSRNETEAAETKAAGQLAEAQKRLDKKVDEVHRRQDLDERAKKIMVGNLRNVEERRLEVVKANIEQGKELSIDKARTEMEMNIARIQRGIKWWAAALPPIPALLLAVIMFAYRYNREKIGVSERRRVGAN
ncbi:MAG: Gldg family protein [Phycisphaerae bacterium]|nr:Gldg family protein [Phycisphaerae bacterium]